MSDTMLTIKCFFIYDEMKRNSSMRGAKMATDRTSQGQTVCGITVSARISKEESSTSAVTNSTFHGQALGFAARDTVRFIHES